MLRIRIVATAAATPSHCIRCRVAAQSASAMPRKTAMSLIQLIKPARCRGCERRQTAATDTGRDATSVNKTAERKIATAGRSTRSAPHRARR